MLEFAPIDTGDLTEVPPDAPDGEWVASCTPKASLNKEGLPRIVLEWTLTEACTDGNEDFVGTSVTDWFLVFYPARHKNSKNGRRTLKAVCAACNIDVPVLASVTPEDIEALVQQLDGAKARIWTKNKAGADGEMRTSVFYQAPRGAVVADDSEEEEKPAAAAKKAAPAAAAKKKVSKKN